MHGISALEDMFSLAPLIQGSLGPIKRLRVRRPRQHRTVVPCDSSIALNAGLDLPISVPLIRQKRQHKKPLTNSFV